MSTSLRASAHTGICGGVSKSMLSEVCAEVRGGREVDWVGLLDVCVVSGGSDHM